MALHDIQAIFFDIGSTLRVTDKDPAFIAEGRRKLAALARSDEDPEVFYKKLKDRYDVYREASKVALLDYPEIELWQQIMLPDVDGEYVAAHAQELTTLWRDGTNGKRLTRFDTVDTIEELYRGNISGTCEKLSHRTCGKFQAAAETQNEKTPGRSCTDIQVREDKGKRKRI